MSWWTDVYSHSPKNETSSQIVKALRKKAVLLCGRQRDSGGKSAGLGSQSPRDNL